MFTRLISRYKKTFFFTNLKCSKEVERFFSNRVIEGFNTKIEFQFLSSHVSRCRLHFTCFAYRTFLLFCSFVYKTFFFILIYCASLCLCLCIILFSFLVFYSYNFSFACWIPSKKIWPIHRWVNFSHFFLLLSHIFCTFCRWPFLTYLCKYCCK